jgi:RNA-directed DNA polymerase
VYEQSFLDCSYGFRPGRSAHQALRVVRDQTMKMAGRWVLEVDLRKFFDSIPHAELRPSLVRRIADGKLLRLLKLWLTAAVEERDEDGKIHHSGGKRSYQGTPQGGVISPLLANLYMNRFLKHWRRQGKGQQFRARLINYADDRAPRRRGKEAPMGT